MLVALILPFLFGLAGVVVDGSTLMAERRVIQNAADAAALAAAQELPVSGTCDATCQINLKTVVESFSAKNDGPSTLDGGFGGRCLVAADTNCYTNPYKGSDQLVEVRLHKPVQTLFAGAIGLAKTFSVSARAVASAAPVTSGVGPTTTTVASTHVGTTVPGTTITNYSTSTVAGGNIALFAKDTACGSVDQAGIFLGSTGNSLQVTGLSISNGSVWVDGNSSTHLDAVNYGGPNHCPLGGSESALEPAGGIGAAATHNEDFDWPQTWDKATICNSAGPAVHYFKNDLSTDNHTITSSGIWCADNGTLTLNANNGTFHVTVIGPKLSISAQHLVLTPYPAANDALTNNLLFYQTQGDFTFQPNNSDVNGWMWVPNGRLTFGGNSGSQGFYEAKDITIQGNSFHILGNGPEGLPLTSTTSSTTTVDGLTDMGTTVTTTHVTPGTTSTIGTTIGLGE